MDKIADLGRLAPIITQGDQTFGAALRGLPCGGPEDLVCGRILAQGLGSARLAATVTLVLRAGALTLEGAEAKITLHPGEAALIGKGTDLAWAATAADLVVICDATAEPRQILAKPDLAQTLAEGTGPNPALLRSAAPQVTHHGFFAEAALSAGLWAATPYDRAPIDYGFSEAMYVLEGTITPYDDSGAALTFTKGDVFVILAGARAGWRNPETVRKLYVIRQQGA